MGFLEKVEHFISQLQYSLAFEPEPIINYEGVAFYLSLPPHIFFEIIEKFKIDSPFNYQSKIIELKILKRKEGITEKEALDIIQNNVNSYSINLLPPIVFSQQLFLLLKAMEISSENKSKREKAEKFEKIKQNFDKEYKEEQVSALDFLQNSELLHLINDFQLLIEVTKNLILKELMNAMKDIQQSKENSYTVPPIIEESKIDIVPNLNNLPKPTDIPRNSVLNSFVDYFYHPKKEILVPMLKEEFIKDKGKTIKILIEILVEEKILALESGEFKRFYSSMKDYFGTDIGTYQSINDYVVNKTKHTKAYDAVKIRIDYILKNIA